MELTAPRGLDDALATLAGRDDVTVLAGGTDLMVEVNFGRRAPTAVLSLRHVDELRGHDTGLAADGGRIGAGTTFAQLSRLTGAPLEGLAHAARTVGSPQIREAATIGGNLGTASPAGDGLVYLAALDAEIELVSADGTRRLRWDRYLTGPKTTARRPDELIAAVHLPARMPVRTAFGKIGVRDAMVIAIASACVAIYEDGRVAVALGSVGPTVLRASEAEALASDIRHPTEADLVEFAGRVSAASRPIDDHRATAAYRRHAVGVLARRLWERIR